ncbi:hypothetical protein BD779DRAFT_1479404 [Infundibulicybe gibba]|nr:hypothetical protein BD779DRAFT_1479404 [Infundibulicybe gibba]
MSHLSRLNSIFAFGLMLEHKLISSHQPKSRCLAAGLEASQLLDADSISPSTLEQDLDLTRDYFPGLSIIHGPHQFSKLSIAYLQQLQALLKHAASLNPCLKALLDPTFARSKSASSDYSSTTSILAFGYFTDSESDHELGMNMDIDIEMDLHPLLPSKIWTNFDIASLMTDSESGDDGRGMVDGYDLEPEGDKEEDMIDSYGLEPEANEERDMVHDYGLEPSVADEEDDIVYGYSLEPGADGEDMIDGYGLEPGADGGDTIDGYGLEPANLANDADGDSMIKDSDLESEADDEGDVFQLDPGLESSEDDEGGIIEDSDSESESESEGLGASDNVSLPTGSLQDPTVAGSSHQSMADLDYSDDLVSSGSLNPFVVKFNSGTSHSSTSQNSEQSGYCVYMDKIPDQINNPYAPFISKLDWEVARWAKLRGPGSTAVSDLLAIEGIQQKLGLSFKNSRELNKIIDAQIPDQPKFKCRNIGVAGESFELYYRNPIDCIRSLFGNPEFCNDLLMAPEMHFTRPNKQNQVYSELNTGSWWWETQEKIDQEKPGGTIIPVIISSDKTQLTTFCGKQAYPVYLTIGNIPKDIRKKPSRHAQVPLHIFQLLNLSILPIRQLDAG